MLTEKEKQDLENEIKPIFEKAKAEAVKDLSETIVNRFSPGETSTAKILSYPEDRIVADKLGGFKSIPHYFEELATEGRTHQAPETLKAWENAVRVKDLSEDSLSSGGYLAPEQVLTAVMEKTLEESIVRPRARIQPMVSNRIVIPADVDANHATNYFGGITIYRPGEAGQKTATSPTYERIALTLHKVIGLCHVSDELLEDSAIAVAADVTRKFGQAIAFVQDYDFLNGTGNNQPLGIIPTANPAQIVVTAETGQGANTIVAENIAKMWSRMYPAGQSRAVWIANIDTFPQLFGMALAVGTGGVPIWLPAGGVSGAPYQTLMGRPLIYTEKCSTLGTAGDIILADLSQYVIGEKAGLQVATSIHFKFDYDQQSFRFVLRYDGQPTWTSPLTPRVSTSTLSPFIVLSSTRT